MREGPQPPACVIESCDERPAGQGEVYCKAHLATMAGGSALTPPIVEPDDPELLERLAKKAAEQEEREYAERRRVKTWRTLENGSRVPETFWSDGELEAIEAEVAQQAEPLVHRFASKVTTPSHEWHFDSRTGERIDPEKQQLKTLKKALRGKLGPVPRQLTQALAQLLEDTKPSVS